MHASEPESWRPVVGYEGLYEVSDLGRVWSLGRTDSTGKTRRPRMLRGSTDNAGYQVFGLTALSLPGQPGKQRFLRVHTLVLTAFVGPCPPGLECCHDNGDPGDNRLANLRWDTSLANAADIKRHGTALTGVAARAERRRRSAGRPKDGFCKRSHRLVEPNLTNAKRRRCRACCNAHNRVKDAMRLRAQLLDLDLVAAEEYRRIMGAA